MLELGKYVKIGIQTSSDPFFRGFFKNKKRTGAGNFWAAFLEYFFDQNFYLDMLLNLAKISSRYCVYFKSYSVECICFIIRHLMR